GGSFRNGTIGRRPFGAAAAVASLMVDGRTPPVRGCPGAIERAAAPGVHDDDGRIRRTRGRDHRRSGRHRHGHGTGPRRGGGRGRVGEDARGSAAGELAGGGAAVHTVRTDVGDRASVEALADETVRRFGGVHVVCNNAGIALFGEIAQATHADWEYTMRVNFW